VGYLCVLLNYEGAANAGLPEATLVVVVHGHDADRVRDMEAGVKVGAALPDDESGGGLVRGCLTPHVETRSLLRQRWPAARRPLLPS